jgi:hypothetical protein
VVLNRNFASDYSVGSAGAGPSRQAILAQILAFSGPPGAFVGGRNCVRTWSRPGGQSFSGWPSGPERSPRSPCRSWPGSVDRRGCGPSAPVPPLSPLRSRPSVQGSVIPRSSPRTCSAFVMGLPRGRIVDLAESQVTDMRTAAARPRPRPTAMPASSRLTLQAEPPGADTKKGAMIAAPTRWTGDTKHADLAPPEVGLQDHGEQDQVEDQEGVGGHRR